MNNETQMLNIINLIVNDSLKSAETKINIIKDLVNKKAYEIQTTYNKQVYHTQCLLLNDNELKEYKEYRKQSLEHIIYIKQISLNKYYKFKITKY